MTKMENRSVVWVGIIASFLILLVDIRYMVSFHYLPYAAGNLNVRGEIKEILSLFTHDENLRLFVDILLLLICFLRLFIKKKRLLEVFLFTGVGLRVFCLFYDSYVNIFPIVCKNSTAVNIVTREWTKNFLTIMSFISIIIISHFFKCKFFSKNKRIPS
jgi:cytochrome bd-type quinol oxidase subunit 2